MVHFNNKTTFLMGMTNDEKKNFLVNVDLNTVDFEIKIADYGLSTKVKN